MAKILIIADPNDPLGRERGLAGEYGGHLIFWFSTPKANLPNVTAYGLPAKFPLILIQLLSPFSLLYAIMRIKPDIIHVHYARQPVVTLPLLLHRVVIVSTMGGDILPDQSYRGIGAYFVRMLLNHAACITSKSDFMDAALAKIGEYKHKIKRVTWGIDIEKFRPDRDVSFLRKSLNIPNDHLVFFDPRLARPLYNKDIIISGFAQYLHSGSRPNAVLVVAESFPDLEYAATLHQQVNDLKIGDKVRFAGAIEHSAMPDYYALADVTISVPNSDGLPQTIFEALASGSFLIAGDLPQYAGLLNDEVTAKTVPIKNAEAITAALIAVTARHSNRADLALRGRDCVKKLADKHSQIKLVNDIYSELLMK